MADLVVLSFDGVDSADAVLTKLRQLKKQELIDLLDACVVVRPEEGDIHIKQSVNMTRIGASTGLSTGAIVGMLAVILVLNPLAGMAVGGLSGRQWGRLGDPFPITASMMISSKNWARPSNQIHRLCFCLSPRPHRTK